MIRSVFIKSFLLGILFFQSCGEKKEDRIESEKHEYPLKLGSEAYERNPIFPGPVEPLRTSKGDTIQTGVSLKIWTKDFADQEYVEKRKLRIRKREMPSPLSTTFRLDTVSVHHIAFSSIQSRAGLNDGQKPFVLRNIWGEEIKTGVRHKFDNISDRITIPPNNPVDPLITIPKLLGQLKVLDVSHGVDPFYEAYYTHEPEKGPNGSWWIGGVGLKRYDGFHIQTFLKSNGLGDDVVIDLKFDKDDNLWILHPSSITFFDGKTFRVFDGKAGLPDNSYNKLFIDSRNQVLIGSKKGLLIVDQHGFEFITKNEGLPLNETTHIQEDDKNGYFLNHGTNISYLNEKGIKTLDLYSLRNTDGYTSGIRSLFYSKNSGLWLGLFARYSPLFNYKDDTLRIMQVIDDSIIPDNLSSHISDSKPMAIKEDKKGRIWWGAWVSGLYCIEKDGSVSNYNSENALNDNFILSVKFDEHGNIWVGGRNNGINILRPNASSMLGEFDSMAFKYTWEIEEYEGKIWFASRYNGLGCLSNNKLMTYGYSGYNLGLARSVLVDSKDNFWLLSNEINGITKFSKGYSEQYVFARRDYNEYLEGDYDFRFDGGACLVEDEKGRIWFNSAMDHQNPGFFDHKLNFSFLYEYPFGSKGECSLKDKDGNIWFGGNTLKKISKGDSVFHYSAKEGMFFSRISSLLEDPKGRIWFASSEGLGYFDGKQFRYLDKEIELLNSNVEALAQTGEGQIIITHPQGISILQEEGENFSATYFDNRDGLQGKSNYKNSVLLDSKKDLWIGSSVGTGRVSLESLLEKKSPPILYINELKINGRSFSSEFLNQDKMNGIEFSNYSPFNHLPVEPEIPFSFNHFSFIFSSSDLLNSHRIEYSFRLRKNDDWTVPQEGNEIDLRNLDFGSYDFELRARYLGGEWGPSRHFLFKVLPPVYLTWWAWSIYIILFVLLLYLVYRFQLRRQFEKQEALNLREMDEMKSQFFTNISHEFRTPLTLIKGVSEMIGNDYNSNDKEGVERRLKQIDRNSDQLLNLVDQILELSKLESGNEKLIDSEIDLNDYLKKYANSFESAFELKRLKFEFKGSSDPMVIKSDESTLDHIFQNLIGNALKYTEEGGVEIEIKEEGKRAVVKILDTGIGIANDQLGFVFDRFYRSVDGGGNQPKGTGIGLALTKQLADLVNADIKVESELGKGSCFEISFPLIENADQRRLIKTKEKTQGPEAEAPEFVLETKHDLNKATLLIVEDNSDLRNHIAELLNDEYNLLLAKDGEIGLEMAKEHIPDFIISDWMMPTKSGPEMIQELKENRLTSHIPCMLLTARADKDSKLSGYEKGAEAYLTKPFEADEFRLQVKALIRSRDSIRNYFENTDPKEDQPSPYDAEAEFMKEVLDLVRERLGESELNGAKIASGLTVGRSQLARKIMAISNQTITQLIRSERITKSKELLREGRLNVSEIAYEVGFTDPAYFSRTFSQEEGIPPSEFS